MFKQMARQAIGKRILNTSHLKEWNICAIVKLEEQMYELF